ncbi:unnamed protein product [[Candida] boidinii]|uniref:Unnamed protein product n=1 Tax=Candida boidinii TaxID=5477 RepID=A0A9W6T757_CANBO|nr:unnamed protein product [[Candida] boidinii]
MPFHPLVFERYKSQFENAPDLTIRVDSFTSKPIDDTVYGGEVEVDPFEIKPTFSRENSVPDFDDNDNDDNLLDSETSTSSTNTRATSIDPMEEQEEEDSVEESKFGIPYYIDLLLSSKEEAENPISNIHLRAHQDRQLMFVEELSTISMIFRNISFVKDNNIVMAENSIFQDFIFKLIMHYSFMY